jgi:hypothetical protein
LNETIKDLRTSIAKYSPPIPQAPHYQTANSISGSSPINENLLKLSDRVLIDCIYILHTSTDKNSCLQQNEKFVDSLILTKVYQTSAVMNEKVSSAVVANLFSLLT